MLLRKVLCKDRLPEKEGRYIVGWDENLTSLDGKHSETIHVVFQADYNERYSFHEEYSDCSRVEWWWEKVKEPTEEEIRDRLMNLFPDWKRTWEGTVRIIASEVGYKQALKDLKGE